MSGAPPAGAGAGVTARRRGPGDERWHVGGAGDAQCRLMDLPDDADWHRDGSDISCDSLSPRAPLAEAEVDLDLEPDHASRDILPGLPRGRDGTGSDVGDRRSAAERIASNQEAEVLRSAEQLGVRSRQEAAVLDEGGRQEAAMLDVGGHTSLLDRLGHPESPVLHTAGHRETPVLDKGDNQEAPVLDDSCPVHASRCRPRHTVCSDELWSGGGDGGGGATSRSQQAESDTVAVQLVLSTERTNKCAVATRASCEVAVTVCGRGRGRVCTPGAEQRTATASATATATAEVKLRLHDDVAARDVTVLVQDAGVSVIPESSCSVRLSGGRRSQSEPPPPPPPGLTVSLHVREEEEDSTPADGAAVREEDTQTPYASLREALAKLTEHSYDLDGGSSSNGDGGDDDDDEWAPRTELGGDGAVTCPEDAPREEPSIGNSGSRFVASDDDDRPVRDADDGGVLIEREVCRHEPTLFVSDDSYYDIEYVSVLNDVAGVDSSAEDMRHKHREDSEAASGAATEHSASARSILKSVLKRTGSRKAAKSASRKKHRVQFNESLNKFFEADYVILIREEGDCDADIDTDGDADIEDVCTCDADREMVRIAADEDAQAAAATGFHLSIPGSCTFEPPLEFVDHVTLSPPEGYKDVVNQQQQRSAAMRPDAGPQGCPPAAPHAQTQTRSVPEEPPSPLTKDIPVTLTGETQAPEGTETPAVNFPQQRYIVETITMTTVTERRIVREADDTQRRLKPSGILKGGKLWKSADGTEAMLEETSTSFSTSSAATSSPVKDEDADGAVRRSVHFSKESAANGDSSATENNAENGVETAKDNVGVGGEASSPESTELTLTFRLGSHVLLSNNLRPDSAVRQLFPAPRFLSPPPLQGRTSADSSADSGEESSESQTTDGPSPAPFVVTAESLRLFEEAKRCRLPQAADDGDATKQFGGSDASSHVGVVSPGVTSDDDDSTSSQIRRTIERNALRRSLLRYEPGRSRRAAAAPGAAKSRSEDSLVERIRKLTCDLDEEEEHEEEQEGVRGSPLGEEAVRSAEPVVSKTSSPSSASSSSSASSGSATSAYKKLTDLFARRVTGPGEAGQPEWNVAPYYSSECVPPPDLGNGLTPRDAVPDDKAALVGPKCAVSRVSVTAEARKQFLSTLAPLAACVSASGTADEDVAAEIYHTAATSPSGDRTSLASTNTTVGGGGGGPGSEYSLDDIEDALRDEEKAPQPDVVAGTQTPGLAGAVDELALFVQRDAGRIERIKRRYCSSSTPTPSDEDDHDDYGFNRRPSVRGIKPRFGSTTEILQQMQTQLQPPLRPWPYCSPEGTPVTGEPPHARRRGVLQARPPVVGPMPVLQEETACPYDYGRSLAYGSVLMHQQSPTEGTRRDTMGRRYAGPNQMMYASTGSLYQPAQQIMRIGGGCGDAHVYGAHSPPRSYTQPVLSLPCPESAGLVPRFSSPMHPTGSLYARRPPPGVLQMRVSPVSSGPTAGVRLLEPNITAVIEPQYAAVPGASVIRVGHGQQQTIRVPYPPGAPVQVHLLTRSASPHRGLQSPSGPTPTPPQYAVARATQTGGAVYPARYGPPPGLTTCDASKAQMQSRRATSPTSYQNVSSSSSSTSSSSPTRSKYVAERGAPEGAASCSPSFPQEPVPVYQPPPPAPPPTATSVYYAMNV